VAAARLLELSALVLAAMRASCLREQEPASADRAIMPPSFVVVFTALMLLDGPAAMVVAAAAALTPGFVTGRAARRQSLVDAVIAVVAVQSAELTHQSLVHTLPRVFLWPFLAVTITAGVAAYHVVQGALQNVVVPFITRGPINRVWARRPLAGCPLYLFGAGVAAVIVMMIDARMWDVAPVAAVAIFFLYRIYAEYVQRLEEAHRRSEVLEYLEQGMSVLDREGRVTLWNDALERMLRCPRAQAIGRPLAAVLPALGSTELPGAIIGTIADGQGRILNHLRLATGTDTRIVQVKILPVSHGVSLLWHDVTERARVTGGFPTSRRVYGHWRIASILMRAKRLRSA
jgi:PAS domain S-box-containing protein